MRATLKNKNILYFLGLKLHQQKLMYVIQNILSVI